MRREPRTIYACKACTQAIGFLPFFFHTSTFLYSHAYLYLDSHSLSRIPSTEELQSSYIINIHKVLHNASFVWPINSDRFQTDSHDIFPKLGKNWSHIQVQTCVCNFRPSSVQTKHTKARIFILRNIRTKNTI